ncbi:MAG TPA: HAMP domain-containing sensor histidine kinase [Pyrinomonadaceae bacterium]|nr:HAMP domain-containing sensor histidine kinase [Pyrinomonadaceae bacterium]
MFALAVALSYGAGQLAYATNPIIAYSAYNPRANSPFFSWMGRTIGIKVDEFVVRSNYRTGRNVTPLEFLDSAVYAVLLPLRYGLFVPSFLLYLLFIISINDFRRTLNETTSRRKDYLSSDGIVRAIAESLGADNVSLFIRLPGHEDSQSRSERAVSFSWPSKATPLSRATEALTISDDPLLMEIMNVKGEEIVITPDKGIKVPRNIVSADWPSGISLAVPVTFQGGVIGVLRADLQGYGSLHHTTRQKLRLMAQLIGPSVQDFRSLAAVDQIGFRLTRLQVDHPEDTLEMATERMIGVLHDVLAPLATGMVIDMGFLLIEHVYPRGNPALRLPLEQLIKKENDGGQSNLLLTNSHVKLEQSQMLVRKGKGEYSRLGSLMLAVPSERDDFSRPTLAAYYLNRRMVASLVTEGVLELVRSFFSLIMKDLGVEFSREGLSKERWFDIIARATRKAGLLWVAVENVTSEEWMGPEEGVRDASSICEELRTPMSKESMSSFVVGESRFSAQHIVRLELPRSKHQLWLGVARLGFGHELDFQSPWKMFLSDLAYVADVALDSIQTRQKIDSERLIAAQDQGLMTIAITTGTLMHQLVNMIKDQLSATESLEEALEDKGINLDASDTRLLSTMKRSALQMKELTEAFKGVTKMEGRRPCSVADAAEQAVKLFQVSLLQREIETKIDISPNVEADVPFHVASFALANLIGNAKDAIKSHGTIKIESEEEQQYILCHVTNSGPVIPSALRATLFRFGASGKAGHNGWGLYFVARALQENGGSISIDDSCPETRFTIRLPKANPK